MANVRSITPLPPADFTPELGNYKTLQPFRYWCQKVLPLVYDNSLSYYELLCKVVDYLNKTMEDVETLHGDVTNLHTAYEKLQSYVNDYFSTLDVQEEINNKLDEMVQNGTLGNLIALMMGAVIDVTKAGVSNDGVDSSGAVSKLINSGNILYFPRGVYNFNDITCTGVSVRMMFDSDAVINVKPDSKYVVEFNECDVSISGGTFSKSDGGRKLSGKSGTSGIFKFVGCSPVKLEGVFFNGCTSADCVYATGCENVVVEDCVFKHFLWAGCIFIDKNRNIRVVNCSFADSLASDGSQYCYPVASGFSQYTTPVEGYIDNFVVENCSFENCDWEAIDCHGGNNVIFQNNYIHNANRFITAYADDRPVIEGLVGWKNIKIVNNYCVNDDDYTPPNPDFMILAHGQPTNYKLSNVIIENNTFINGVVSERFGAISCYYVDQLKINNNCFKWTKLGTLVSGVIRLTYNYNFELKGNEFINHCSTVAVVRVYNSKGEVTNNHAYAWSGTDYSYFVIGIKLFRYECKGNTGDFSVRENATPYSGLVSYSDINLKVDTYSGTFATNLHLRKIEPLENVVNGTVTSLKRGVVVNTPEELVVPGMDIVVTVGDVEYTCVVVEVDSANSTIVTDHVFTETGACTFTYPAATLEKLWSNS